MISDSRLILPEPTASLEFWIPGKPVSKPRMTRQDKWKQRPCVVEYRAFKDLIKLIVGNTLPPVESIVRVNWIAYHEVPKSWSRKKADAHRGRLKQTTPDRDNIDKALLDALWARDEAIAWGTLLKVWCPEGQEPGIRLEVQFSAD